MWCLRIWLYLWHLGIESDTKRCLMRCRQTLSYCSCQSFFKIKQNSHEILIFFFFFSTQLCLIFNPHSDRCMNFHIEQRKQALVCLEIKIIPVHLKTCAAACLTSQSEERNDSNGTPMDLIWNWHLNHSGLELYIEKISLHGVFFCIFSKTGCKHFTHNSILHNHYNLKAFVHKHKDGSINTCWLAGFMETRFSLVTFLYMLFFCGLFWVAC